MGKADMGHQTGLILRYDHGWTDNAISARICRYVSFTFAIAYTSIKNVRPFHIGLLTAYHPWTVFAQRILLGSTWDVSE
jgi:hypothetical protein